MATGACLDSAAQLGWRTDLARVVSSRAVDADKVEVVFDLSRDGRNTARLTCPYSLSRGVATGFGGAGAGGSGVVTALPIVPDGAAAAEDGVPVNPARAWWLLLPLGLGLLSWGGLRGRDQALVAGVDPGAPIRTGLSTPRNLSVEAHAHEGELAVHERADIATRTLRRVRNGERLQLTGHRLNDWLEVVNGGWVRDIDVRYDRNGVRFS